MTDKKQEWGDGFDAYVIRSYDLPKKKIFDGLDKYFEETFFEKLHKQVIWPSQKEIFDGLYKHFWEGIFWKITKKRNSNNWCK